MHKILLIARREIADRFGSSSFRGFLFLGPLIILLGIYIFLVTTSSTKNHWNILIMDKYEVMHNKIATSKPDNFSFSFINAIVGYDEFAKLDKFQKYDLAVSINKKILRNKQVIISYRKNPPPRVKEQLRYLIERRFEELMVKQFTDLSVAKFRDIKQSFNFHYKNTYDPRNKESTTSSWVGFVFGALIILFIFMFGMTILRSVVKDKSNRIVELLLSHVKARELMAGKVLGIGFSALIQIVVWTIIIGGGLYLFRLWLFPDIFSGGVVANALTNKEVHSQVMAQSPFVELVYQQIQYTNIIFFFILFFIGGYLFYGSFFAMIGAGMGSESDGQQFILPLNILLLLSLLAGYFAIYHPGAQLTHWLSFIPFTSPMVMMIDLANGFGEGEAWRLFISLLLLLVSAALMLRLAGRIYKNGTLQYNHRLRWRFLFRWMKR